VQKRIDLLHDNPLSVHLGDAALRIGPFHEMSHHCNQCYMFTVQQATVLADTAI
jgi:hypothetical protein